MNDSELRRMFRVLGARSIGLEYQVLALRRILEKQGLLTEQEFDQMALKIRDLYKDHLLNPQTSDEEAFSEMLRNFEGPVQ